MTSLIGLMLLDKVLSDALLAFERQRGQFAADGATLIRRSAMFENQIGLWPRQYVRWQL
jgi:hypothetical protein